MAQKIEKDKENIKNNLNNSDFVENLAKKEKNLWKVMILKNYKKN